MKTAIITLGALAMATASPLSARQEQSVEVVPGPGLPSLESLGLSSADLNDPNFYENFDIHEPKTEDFTTKAGNCNREVTWAPLGEAQACERYLAALGTQNCVLSDNGDSWTAEFCRSGSTKVVGLNPRKYAASHCRDVAGAVTWVIQNCNENGQVRGSQAAVGNGDLLVGVLGS